MTVSEHTYTATLPGGEPLSIRGGSVTLDAAAAPHVQSSIEVPIPGTWGTEEIPHPVTPGLTLTVPLWTPDPAALDLIDPRRSPAPRVIVTASSGAQARVFDLGVRDRRIVHRDGVVRLTLASDEALLEDYAPLEEDRTPRTLESSLRAVCNYVLNTVIPGAALEALPGNDADVTAYWSLTNLAVNPALRVNAAGWAAGSGASAVERVLAPVILGLPTLRATAAGTGPMYVHTPASGVRVTPGDVITGSAYIASASAGRPGRILLRFWDQADVAILDSYSPAVTTSTDAAAATRLTHTRVVPPNAATVSVIVNTASNVAGQNHYVSCAMLHEGTELVPFFDGASSGGGYTYAWEDVADTSTSTRTPIVERAPESLIWDAGRNALEFLHPLVQAAGFRLVCDEQRRWTLRAEDYAAPGNVVVRVGVNAIEADEQISRDSGIWFDARVTRYRWKDAKGVEHERIDSFALNTPHSRLTRVDVAAPYPGPGRSEYAVRRAQGVGREVTVTRGSKWDTAAEQPAMVTVPDAPVQAGSVRSVEFNFSTDEMAITLRTREVGAGSIDLLTGSIAALTGSIHDL